jgi:hypothetical protein
MNDLSRFYLFSQRFVYYLYFGNVLKKTRYMIFIGDITLIDEKASENFNRCFNTTGVIGLFTSLPRENA